MNTSTGVLMYNKGTGMICRLIVCLESLRKHYRGPVTLFLEGDHPDYLVSSLKKEFGVDIVFDANPETGIYTRAVEICRKTPYEISMWLDSDTLVVGNIDEMVGSAAGYDLAIPHFALWRSDGPMISGRIRDYSPVVPSEWIQNAINYGPAINCGVYSFTSGTKFLEEWNWLSKQGEQIQQWDHKKNRPGKKGIFIPDEKACQVLLPRYNVKIVHPKFNVSVIHDPGTEDHRIIHYHGRKHTFSVPLGYLWQESFCSALERNLCGICEWTAREKANKRTSLWLRGGIEDSGEQSETIGFSQNAKRLIYRANTAIRKYNPELVQGPCEPPMPDTAKETKSTAPHPDNQAKVKTTVESASLVGIESNLTVVTACDPKYVECLKHTFPNWRKYKGIDRWPVIVFVNGMEIDDPRLSFLNLPNVTLVRWESGVGEAPKTDDHRELMLSAFVFGAAKHVTTQYWLKLDADSFATNASPIVDDSMTQFAFIGHRWGYSWEKHIKALDEWAEKHGDQRLRSRNGPMYPRGTVSGRRFYHSDRKRTISFAQVNSTEFTRLCVKMVGNRLPAPSQDTCMFYIADRMGFPIGIDNFKKRRGFDQGKGHDIPGLLKKLAAVEDGTYGKDEADE